MDLVTASDTAELGVDPAEAMKKIQTFKAAWLAKMTAMNFDGTLVGILHTKNDSLADVVKDEGTEVLFGQDYFYDELLGLKFKITPFSFFQTNSLGAEVLYETAREYIGDTNEKSCLRSVQRNRNDRTDPCAGCEESGGVEIVEKR